MNQFPRQMRSTAVCFAAALFVCFGMTTLRLAGQSPLFPNNNAVYYNPYGQGMYTNNYAQVYGQSFGFKPLPAAYSQSLPASNFGYRTPNYPTNPGYGGSMYIRNYGGSNQAYYNPYGSGS